MRRIAWARLILFVLVVVVASFVVQAIIHESIHFMRSSEVSTVCLFGLRSPQEGWISLGWVTATHTDPNSDLAILGGILAQFLFVAVATILYAFRNPELSRIIESSR